MPTPNLVTSLGRQRTEIIASYTIPGNVAAGAVIQGSVTGFGPLVGAQTTIVLPISEVWHVEDIYCVGGPAFADAVVVTFVNGYQQNIAPALSSINLNLLTRFDIGETIVLPPASTFATSLSMLAAGPATGGTQLVKYKIVKEPFTG